jgi:hypothetical protein
MLPARIAPQAIIPHFVLEIGMLDSSRQCRRDEGIRPELPDRTKNYDA